MSKRAYSAAREHHGYRVDVFLSREIAGLSRRKARELCDAGEILMNDKPCRPGARVSEGDVILVLGSVEQISARPELIIQRGNVDGLVRIVFEESDFVVLEKERGIPCVTLSADDPPTVADCLAYLYPECASSSPDSRESGLVQRLDTFSSGLLLAARNNTTWGIFHHALLAGDVRKRYLALVEGVPKKERWTVRCHLAQSPDGKSMRVVDEHDANRDTVETESHCRTLWSDHGLSFIAVRGYRMRRHQVRVHLAHSGHPLVGDAQYGAKKQLGRIPWWQKSWGEDGFFLHASELALEHHQGGERMVFHSEHPAMKKIPNEKDVA